MVTVAQIAAKAFDAVAAKITDAIHPATLNWVDRGAYDPISGSYPETERSASGRVVEDSTKPVADVFEDYVAGPRDTLVLMEGFSEVPKENWKLEYNDYIGDDARVIKRVQDIVAANSLFYVVVI